MRMAAINHAKRAGQRQSINQIETVLRMDVDIYRKFVCSGIEIRRLISRRAAIDRPAALLHIYIKGKQAIARLGDERRRACSALVEGSIRSEAASNPPRPPSS